ncbi:MAG: hypothetical protein KKG75_01160 [Nanoarchaeota archaeon]|nr:hypothetical protein [Nanoarchaeota archaeon]
MTEDISQKEAIESAWRESHETNEKIGRLEENIPSKTSKWDKVKTKWDRRQKRHSYWRLK